MLKSLQDWFSDKKVNLQILFLLSICALVTYPSTSMLVNEWLKWDQALSHGFACLALLVFFIWRQPFIILPDIQFSRGAIVFLTLGSLLWCCAQLANLQLPSYAFIFVCFWFLLAVVYSWQFTIKLLPLLGIFVFAIPIWSTFNDLLVELSSNVVNGVLKYSNLVLHIQDNQIMTPWGTIVIADGCSGLRYLVIALLIGYLLCLLNRYSIKISITTLIIAALLGLITNWIRILIIILVGYYTEMQHSLVRDHEFFGWILFASILFPALYFSPQYKITLNPIAGQAKFSWAILFAGLVGPIIYFLIPFNNHTNPLNLSFLNQQYPSSIATPQLDIQYPPGILAEKTNILLNQIPVSLTLLKSTPKQKNEKIVPFMSKLYNYYYWKSIQQFSLENSELEILEHRQNQQKIILIYKFQVGSFTTTNYYQAKILQIPAKLLNQAYFGLWLAQVSCQSDCAQEVTAIKQFDAQW
jgi:exosortase